MEPQFMIAGQAAGIAAALACKKGGAALNVPIGELKKINFAPRVKSSKKSHDTGYRMDCHSIKRNLLLWDGSSAFHKRQKRLAAV